MLLEEGSSTLAKRTSSHELARPLELRCSQEISSERGDEWILRGELVLYDARHELSTGHGPTLG